jgi:hypothetical protein
VEVWSCQRDGRNGTAFSVFIPFQDALESNGQPDNVDSESGAEAVSAG